ncbi:hypothetical protein PGT21_012374 [Puccinia graminis f. sp. tritici]|uniref:Uncharacterized protein n=1 Tax=Puccinia graminis f. sp. tritici TaxID=56615 RepID=A0A5B0NA80_PUCGR|nr:hypothetical protein PGTUg99_006637 [Puccinia graminis f. sp. tritici]KAA1118996.1 hypothetical protein PGT21_012374 [Puccinia graminis f. sp. tritici]
MRLARDLSLAFFPLLLTQTSALPIFSKPLGTIGKAALFDGGDLSGGADANILTNSAYKNRNVEDILGDFLLQCAYEVLDCFDKNYDVLFKPWNSPENKTSDTLRREFKVCHKEFNIEGGCFFQMIDFMFDCRTKYFRHYNKFDRDEFDEMLANPRLSPKFYAIIQKIDRISSKTFTEKYMDIDQSGEYKEKYMKISIQFRLAFLSHLYGKLEWPLPERSIFQLPESSYHLAKINRRIARVAYWHMYVRPVQDFRLRKTAEKKMEEELYKLTPKAIFKYSIW